MTINEILQRLKARVEGRNAGIADENAATHLIRHALGKSLKGVLGGAGGGGVASYPNDDDENGDDKGDDKENKELGGGGEGGRGRRGCKDV